MRKPIVAGNWKMNTLHDEALALAASLRESIGQLESVERILIPPFPWIVPVADAVDGSGIQVGAQNCYTEANGAFTGEVAAEMLQSHCSIILAGHSERRHILGESDALVGAKVEAILRAGLTTILCVGETIEERDSGQAEIVVARQLQSGLGSVSELQMQNVVIAYEPVWAIGTGKAASSDDAQEMSAFVRDRLADSFTADIAASTRVLYGGSVNDQNAAEYFACADVDGALVGGASLKPDAFTAIVEAAASSN